MTNNLLRYSALRTLLTSRLYPAVFQAVTAAVFVVILFQLVAGPTSAHSNLGTALTWVAWWPLIPIIFVLLGRFWCAICPFGTLSDLVQKYVGNQRPVPAFLKKYGIWIIDALFILITWADHVWGIVESPWGSGVLLLLLTTGVVVSGAFWERRAWCRYLCFLGGLAGNYARAGMVALRADPKICATCKARAACYNGNEKGPGCPMFEFPRQMDSNARCTLCAACIKTCPNNAIQISVRPPTKELWFVRKPKFEEAFLAMVIMGIVFVQNITMLEVWESILAGLQRLTGTDSYAVNFTVTFLIAMAIPVGLLLLATLVAGRYNRDSVAGNFAKFGYAIIPLDIAGHIAHNLYHLLAEGKAIAFTTLELFGQPANESSPALVSIPTIQVLQYILIALGAAASLYAVYAIAKNHYGTARNWAALTPYAVLVSVLFAVNLWLFILPMGGRMESHAHAAAPNEPAAQVAANLNSVEVQATPDPNASHAHAAPSSSESSLQTAPEPNASDAQAVDPNASHAHTPEELNQPHDTMPDANTEQAAPDPNASHAHTPEEMNQQHEHTAPAVNESQPHAHAANAVAETESQWYYEPEPKVWPAKVNMEGIFPPGEGRELVLWNCMVCHSFVRIVLGHQDHSHDTGVLGEDSHWDSHRVLHRARLTTLSEEELDILYAYLKANFNDSKPGPKLPSWLKEYW